MPKKVPNRFLKFCLEAKKWWFFYFYEAFVSLVPQGSTLSHIVLPSFLPALAATVTRYPQTFFGGLILLQKLVRSCHNV